MVPQCWPGFLVQFAAKDNQVRRAALARLRADWAAFSKASELREASPWLHKIVQASPFSTQLMEEVATFAAESGDVADDDVLTELAELSTTLFSGFGQTKVIEDGIQRLRGQEERALANRSVDLARQWASLRDKGVAALHRRPEVDAAATVHLQNPKIDDSVFDYYNTTPSVDTSAIQETLTWPSFTAQGSQSIPVGQALLADCHKRDDFEAASGRWTAACIPSGTFVEDINAGVVLLLCGVVGCMAHVAWDVEVATKAKGEVFYRPNTDDSAAWHFEFLYR